MSVFRVRVDMQGGYTGQGFLGRMEVSVKTRKHEQCSFLEKYPRHV